MPTKIESQSYQQLFAGRGLRLTEQRRHVYDVLMSKRDHPTATEVFMRVKKTLPSISLATVYNCLETLSGCGLVKHVHHERDSSRYCPNLEEHGHFFCEICGAVFDVPLQGTESREWKVPRKAVITHYEVSLRGQCPECAKNSQN